MKRKIILLLSMVIMLAANAQDKIIIGKDTLVSQSQLHKKSSVYKQLIIPTVLIGYGAMGLVSDGIKDVNHTVRSQMSTRLSGHTVIDDYTRYAPVVSVYALNLAGIKGKHNYKDLTIIVATSHIIMVGAVMGLKSSAKVERPDGSTDNSFPSGHTATAFAGAEILWQEYKDVSPWYGIAGYVVASGTGMLRIYNDRHWLTDVAAGAGIGILSSKLAYWLHPFIQKSLFSPKEENSKVTGMVMPFYNGEQAGLAAVIRF
jgi:membrane-associated phospholipid phosphatase